MTKRTKWPRVRGRTHNRTPVTLTEFSAVIQCRGVKLTTFRRLGGERAYEKVGAAFATLGTEPWILDSGREPEFEINGYEAIRW